MSSLEESAVHELVRQEPSRDSQPSLTLDTVIGQRLHQLRQARNLTLSEFAQLCKVTESSLARCEQGLQRIAVSDIVRIATACGLPVRYFHEA